MRKTISILALAAFIITASCDKVTPPKSTDTMRKGPAMELTEISFDKTEHDFGQIPATGKVQTKFTFTNTGTADLLITGAVGSCGCTVPEYTKEPVKPGASGEILVSFNPAGKKGKQKKSITLTANTKKAAETLYVISDIVEADTAK